MTAPSAPRRRPRNLKRTLFAVTLLLFGGAILNVAVAWGCTRWSIPIKSASSESAEFQRIWLNRRPAKFPDEFQEIASPMEAGFGITDSQLSNSSEKDYDSPRHWNGDEWVSGRLPAGAALIVYQARWIRAGWPVRSVEGGFFRTVTDGPDQGWWVGSIPLQSQMPSSFAHVTLDRFNCQFLPRQFIWPGFAINTLFYAAVLWGLFAFPFAMRRRLVIRGRIKRGKCPACAYPVGSSLVCTECGGR